MSKEIVLLFGSIKNIIYIIMIIMSLHHYLLRWREGLPGSVREDSLLIKVFE